jgi:protein arginine kinase
MLHLPALKLTGEIDKALRAARDMKLAVRGLYGEGTDALGDFFQISNQITLGRSEKDIVEEFLSVIVPELLNYERKARQAIMSHDSIDIEDKIFRAMAILQSARKITSKETMHRLSMIRLGIHLGKLPNLDLKTVNELFLLAQPAHLQKVLGRELSDSERQKVRADFLRQRLGKIQ